MTTLNITHSLAIYIIALILRIKPKQSVEVTTTKNYETFNEYKGDVMDYDGMGNYGRFPCAK